MGTSDRVSHSAVNRQKRSQVRLGRAVDNAYQDALVRSNETARVAKLVRTLARAQRLTVDQVAEQVGVSKNTIQDLLLRRRLTNRTLDKLKLWARQFIPAK